MAVIKAPASLRVFHYCSRDGAIGILQQKKMFALPEYWFLREKVEQEQNHDLGDYYEAIRQDAMARKCWREVSYLIPAEEFIAAKKSPHAPTILKCYERREYLIADLVRRLPTLPICFSSQLRAKHLREFGEFVLELEIQETMLNKVCYQPFLSILALIETELEQGAGVDFWYTQHESQRWQQEYRIASSDPLNFLSFGESAVMRKIYIPKPINPPPRFDLAKQAVAYGLPLADWSDVELATSGQFPFPD